MSERKNARKERRAAGQGRRWSAADTLIVLAVLLAVAGVLIRAFVHVDDTETPAQGPFEVYFTVSEIRDTVLADIQGFDALYDLETGTYMGSIGKYEDGTPALSQSGVLPTGGGELVTAQGCMVCPSGIWTDGALLPTGSDRYLAPGSVVTLRTERAVMTVEITEIVVRD